MKETWASGSTELLHHAQSHMACESAIDRRLAFISIDNATELMLATYVSLPTRVFGAGAPSRGEIDRAAGKFPRLLDLAYKLNPGAFDEISLNDVDYYHRLRNMLYHEGTGISVDESQLVEYYKVAVTLQRRLFGVDQTSTNRPGSLAHEREAILAEARRELDEGFNQRQSVIVRAANDRIRASGGKLGRGLKPLTPGQDKKIAHLWNSGKSIEAITADVNALGLRSKPPRTISASGVKRRIAVWIAEGKLQPRARIPRREA